MAHTKKANTAQDKKHYVTSVRTKTERVQNVRSDEKWILDSERPSSITNKNKKFIRDKKRSDSNSNASGRETFIFKRKQKFRDTRCFSE